MPLFNITGINAYHKNFNIEFGFANGEAEANFK